MEIQGQKEDFIPPDPRLSPQLQAPRNEGSTLGKTFTSGGGGLVHPPVPLTVLVTVWVKHCCPFKPLAPPPGIPSPSKLLPTSYPMVGTPMVYNFDPMTGRPLRLLMLSAHSLSSQLLGTFSTPMRPIHYRFVNLARAEQGGTSISGWVPVSLIPSGSRWKNTTVTVSSATAGDNPIGIV